MQGFSNVDCAMSVHPDDVTWTTIDLGESQVGS